MIIVAVLLNTIFTFNGFTLTYILTGGGPGGATRIYTILAYEYAVQGLRYGSGIAVAMTTAPALFLLILFLGRFMMNRGDDRDAGGDSAVWRFVMTILWPFRMVLRGVLYALLGRQRPRRDGPRGGDGGGPTARLDAVAAEEGEAERRLRDHVRCCWRRCCSSRCCPSTSSS